MKDTSLSTVGLAGCLSVFCVAEMIGFLSKPLCSFGLSLPEFYHSRFTKAWLCTEIHMRCRCQSLRIGWMETLVHSLIVIGIIWAGISCSRANGNARINRTDLTCRNWEDTSGRMHTRGSSIAVLWAACVTFPKVCLLKAWFSGWHYQVVLWTFEVRT